MNNSRASQSRRQFLKLAAGTGASSAFASAGIPSLIEQLDQPFQIASASALAPEGGSLPPLFVIVYNRMGFGLRAGFEDEAAFNALGADDDARLAAYVEQQLNPNSINDNACDSRIAGAGFITTNKTLQQMWQEHQDADGVSYTWRTLGTREVERLTVMRAVYSRRQLQEVLADFWHNHFNVDAWTFRINAIFMHYDRDVIRANIFGNFREMLEDMAKSSVMLYYLDNYLNTRAGPNENFARELFELHGLGAENYLGVMDPTDVPDWTGVPWDGSGDPTVPLGYVDNDVYEATRCFTGWTVADSDSDPGGSTGTFLYEDEEHDRFSKTILGNVISADQGPLQDGQDVLDFIANHPGTAKFVCRKLVRRLTTDDPPESLVDSAAQIFYDNRTASDQLKQVYRHILNSTEFKTTWGEKVKRPFEATVGVMRATGFDMTFRVYEAPDDEDDDTNSYFWSYNQTGHANFQWPSPDGFPDKSENWLNTTSLIMRWRMVNWIVTREDDNDNHFADIVGQTPNGVNTPNSIVDFWIDRILGRPMSDAGRDVLVDFMEQELTGDSLLDMNDEAVQDRLRSVVSLILMSPEFLQR